MAWKQIKTKVLGNDTARSGSLSRRMLFTWCMLASGILYLVPQNYSNKFQFAFAHVFRFPLNIGSSVSLTNPTQRRIGDTVPRKQYETLNNLYANLDQTYQKQVEQFQRLYGLYNTYVGENMDFVMGNIIPSAADRQHSELTINCKGTNGLETGQFVLARNNSILGRITDISPQLGKAKVRLITDPDSKIAVKIKGLNSNYVLQGNGDGTARINKISTEVKIKEGQQVFALEHSKLLDVSQEQAGFLDAPMIVGTITQCKIDDKAPLLWEITVTPSWKLEELDEVAIIVMRPPGPK